MKLHTLKPAKGSLKTRKRVGRGQGSGRGGTSTRGHKGAQSRSGYKYRPWFEGGQMPLTRRLPRRGFTNRNHKDFKLISLSDLDRCFSAGDVVDEQVLRTQGLIKGKKSPLTKVVSNGALTKALTVKVHACTASAR